MRMAIPTENAGARKRYFGLDVRIELLITSLPAFPAIDHTTPRKIIVSTSEDNLTNKGLWTRAYAFEKRANGFEARPQVIAAIITPIITPGIVADKNRGPISTHMINWIRGQILRSGGSVTDASGKASGNVEIPKSIRVVNIPIRRIPAKAR